MNKSVPPSRTYVTMKRKPFQPSFGMILLIALGIVIFFAVAVVPLLAAIDPLIVP